MVSKGSAYRLSVSRRFVAATLLVTCVAAFAVGKIVRNILIDGPYHDAVRMHQNLLRELVDDRTMSLLVEDSVGRLAHHVLPGSSDTRQPLQASSTQQRRLELPDPVMKHGRIVPQTRYTSKNFDTARSASVSSRWIKPTPPSVIAPAIASRPLPALLSECEGRVSGRQCQPSIATLSPALDKDRDIQVATTGSRNFDGDKDSNSDSDDEQHLPAGQHLLMDIENVDPVFLDSEERLAVAMVDLVNQCGLTLLSYHCHKLTPTGVTCAGVLLESHVSFHTWPERGVITLDLFTCGPNSLLPVVPQAKQLFSIARIPLHPNDKVEQPRVVWAHKLRGFRDDDSGPGPEELGDALNYPIGQRLDYKESIAAVQTTYQKIEIYDAFLLGKDSYKDYEKSIGLGDNSQNDYHMQHPEFFRPDRIVFLDGILQSRRSGDAAYHEALVHPSLFAHPNPKRVAIIGGGEGATLREVLKHSTVEKVVWIEIDQTMVEVSTLHLPEWNDCSNLAGSVGSCLDDPRVEIHYKDAFKWFDDRFPADGPMDELFDVVIMDALDPQVQVDFVDALYSEGTFLKSISRSLGGGGIMVAQVGKAPSLGDPAEDHSIDKNRMKFIQSLIDLDFKHVRNYEESHCGFSAPWEIVVAMKDFDTKADWFDNAAVVDYKIRTRTIPTKDNGVALKYFDGATMASYHFPSRASEAVYCRRIPMPMGCVENRGFDQNRANLPASILEVKQSGLGESAGRGVFALDDIPQKSYVGLERLVHAVYIDPRSFGIIDSWFRSNHMTFNEQHYSYTLESYADAYGHLFTDRGRVHAYADASIHTFINHGCQGTTNVGHNLTFHESVDLVNADDVPTEIMTIRNKAHVYNPSIDRKPHFYSSGFPLRDIAKGEELFDNYLGMTGLASGNWKKEFKALNAQCNSDGLGFVMFSENVR